MPSLVELTFHRARRRIVLGTGDLMMQKAAAVLENQHELVQLKSNPCQPRQNCLKQVGQRCGGWGKSIAPPDLGRMDARVASFNALNHHVACSLPSSLIASHLNSLTDPDHEQRRSRRQPFSLRLCIWTGIPDTSTRNKPTFLTVAAAGLTAHSAPILASSWKR